VNNVLSRDDQTVNQTGDLQQRPSCTCRVLKRHRLIYDSRRKKTTRCVRSQSAAIVVTGAAVGLRIMSFHVPTIPAGKQRSVRPYLSSATKRSVAEWLACWTQVQKARVQIAVATLSGDSLRQTVHSHCGLCSSSSKTGSSPLKGCGDNCTPGGK